MTEPIDGSWIVYIFGMLVWVIWCAINWKKDRRHAKWPGGQCPECQTATKLGGRVVKCNH